MRALGLQSLRRPSCSVSGLVGAAACKQELGDQERKEVPGKGGKRFTPAFLASPLKQMLMCYFAPWLIPSSSHG